MIWDKTLFQNMYSIGFPGQFHCFVIQGKGKGDESSGPPDILSKPAMKNAYYICHNVQVLFHTEHSC